MSKTCGVFRRCQRSARRHRHEKRRRHHSGRIRRPAPAIDSLKGHASWTVADAIAPGELRPAFTIQLDNLHIKNADTEGNVTATYWNQGHGRGNLDLKAKVDHMRK